MCHRASIVRLGCKWQPGQPPKQPALLFTEDGGIDLILGGREPLQLGWGKRFSYQEVAGGWCGELGTTSWQGLPSAPRPQGTSVGVLKSLLSQNVCLGRGHD